MSAVALGIGVGLYGAQQQRTASGRAADLQQAALDRAERLRMQQYGLTQEQMRPWTEAGKAALAEQQALLGMGGDTAGALSRLQSTPGYQSGMIAGRTNLEASSAARGGMGSGKAGEAMTRFGQDYSNQQIGNRLSQLSNISGMGRQAGSEMGRTGTELAGSLSDLWASGANAQGAAGIAGSNATQSGLLGGIQLGLAGYNARNPNNRQYGRY